LLQLAEYCINKHISSSGAVPAVHLSLSPKKSKLRRGKPLRDLPTFLFFFSAISSSSKPLRAFFRLPRDSPEPISFHNNCTAFRAYFPQPIAIQDTFYSIWVEKSILFCVQNGSVPCFSLLSGLSTSRRGYLAYFPFIPSFFEPTDAKSRSQRPSPCDPYHQISPFSSAYSYPWASATFLFVSFPR